MISFNFSCLFFFLKKLTALSLVKNDNSENYDIPFPMPIDRNGLDHRWVVLLFVGEE